MDEEISDIVGAKSKIRIIGAMLPEGGLSINSIAKKAGVAYSVAYRDIHQLIEQRFVVSADSKYMINRGHAAYSRVRGLFSSGEAVYGVNISNRQKKDIKKIIDELGSHEKVQIIVHHNADPDAIGSAVALAIALKHMGKTVTVSAPLGISLQGRAVLEKYPFSVRDENEKSPSVVFIMDSSSFEQVGVLDFRTKPRIILIDHHIRGNLAERADMTFIDTEAHSTAILVYRLMKVSGIDVFHAAAPYILSAIVADTAFFRIADKADIEAVNELLEHAELREIFDALTVKEDISERIAKLKVLRRTELFRVRDLIIGFSQAGSFESRAATHLIKTGADVSFVFNVKKDEIRISGRARKFLREDIDLVKVMKGIEPLIEGSVGGHAEAASANGKNPRNAREIRRMILKEFEKRANSRAKMIN